MVTTRSKARQLEHATNNGGSNQQNPEGTQNTTLANQGPVDAIVYGGAARGAADSDDSTHGKDTESNGALIPQTCIENESSLPGSDSAAAPKADDIIHNDSHAQDLSVPRATLETNAPDEPEVLSDATNKTPSKPNTSTEKGWTKPRGRRGRKPTRHRSKKPLSAADERKKHLEIVDSAGAGSTLVDTDRPPKAETPTHLPSAPRGSGKTLTTHPSNALPSNKGKGKAVNLTESSVGHSQGTGDKKTDAADALLQLWSSRPAAQCSGDRSPNTDEAAGSGVQPRRSYRLEKKKEEREMKEKEEQEKERQEMERQERERQENEEERAKRPRNTGDKAADTRTKKGKATGVPAPRAAAKATKRKREVANVEDVEDAVEVSGPKRKRTTSRPPEQARNETTHDRCSPAGCSVSTFGSTAAFQSSDASEALHASETTLAPRIREPFEPFDVKRSIRHYMRVSEARSTLQESEYEGPLDEDNPPSPVPIFRRIMPPPSEVGFPSQPYYLTRLLSMQLENIWRPDAWRR